MKLTNKYFLYFFASLVPAFFTIIAGAQQLGKVTFELSTAKDSIPVSAAIYTDNNVKLKSFLLLDTLTLSLPASQKFVIKTTASGYKPFETTFNVDTLPTSVFISLLADPKTLRDVVVVAKKPLMRQVDDKTIVDAEPLSNSSTNAYEIMEKTPGAVMVDGNVYLNSATPAVIYINGRDVKMSGDELAALLKNLPAGSVEKLEILRIPSAKYDASTSGGIVNIVLKKGVKIGFNGNVSFQYTQGKYASTSTGISLNNKDGKLNSNFSYNYNQGKNFQDLSSVRYLANGASIKQNAYSIYPTQNHFFRGGVDYEISKKWIIGYSGRMNFPNNKSNTNNAFRYYSAGEPPILSTNLTNNKTTTLSFNNDVDLKYKIDSAGSEWTNAISADFRKVEYSQQYENALTGNGNKNGGNGFTTSRKNKFELESDLTLKTKINLTVETGLNVSYRKYTSNADYQYVPSGEIDYSRSNHFKYTENINSLYLQLSKDFAGVTLKPGVRMENYNQKGFQMFPNDTAFTTKGTSFFPYLYIRRKLFSVFKLDVTGNLVMRKSLERPGFDELNPTLVMVDQYLYNVGNPRLTPQFTTNYELNMTVMDYPVFAVGINEMKDAFTEVTYEDPVTKNLYNTYDNLGKNKEFYLRGTVGIPPGGKYFFFLGGQYNRNHYTGLYNNKPLDQTYDTWMFFMYHDFKFGNNTKANLFGFYRLKSFEKFYELQPFGMVNASVTQTILNKKASLTFSANDIFKMMKFDFALKQDNMNAVGSRYNDSQKFSLKFVYNFGMRNKQDGNKSQPFTLPEAPDTSTN